jgi:hypothetical protein
VPRSGTYSTNLRVVPLALVVAAAMAGAAHGQMFVTTGRDTLRGLPGVEVVVEALQPELEQGGLTQAAIRAAVEARLRGKGIQVYASQKDNPSPAKPYLYVHVNALEIPRQDMYAVAVQVHLRQTLQSPVTESNVVNAMTWDLHNVIGVPAADLGAVRGEIEAYVDRFIEDWTAVH